MDIGATSEAKNKAELSGSPAKVVQRWTAELDLSDKEEERWRKNGDSICEIFEGGEHESSEFNILWANTETMAPAVYNSLPEPDVRRRFRDVDPVGKAAAMVLERALSYSIDTDEFHETIKDAVNDVLLPGRGLARIRYVPRFAPVAADPESAAEGETLPQEAADQPEELVDEEVPVEYVPWRSFRRGPGKRWQDVHWVAFEHDLFYEQLVEMFGEDAAANVPLNGSALEGDKYDDDTKCLFKTAKVWEIWDRDEREALFICTSCKEGPLLTEKDPLEVTGFWPIPRPVYAVRKTSGLVPTPLYSLYEKQAKELERVSQRIKKVTDALKVRGTYDGRLEELNGILDAGDNEMVPIKNAGLVTEMGGLDKAIWTMDISKLITVLQGLYVARDQIKQTIYEITGLSDIIRGSTDPNETAKAQQLKSQWGSLRVANLQSEIARFVKELMRLMADVISTRFSPETLAMITGVQLPTDEEKQQAVMALQQASQPQIDPMTGQPMPPPPVDPQLQEAASKPSWGEVMQVLRSDALRQYKVDIETDSTIADTLDRDMSGVVEVVTTIGNVISNSIPALQSGMLTIDAVKSVCLSIARRARLGSEVEDALDQLQMPQAPPMPEPAPDVSPQIEGALQALEEIKQGMQDFADRSSKPRKLVAQADVNGRVEGTVEEAA